MSRLTDELSTFFWMMVLGIFIAWLTDAWALVGWLLAIIIGVRWILGLWAANMWLDSGGRKLNAFWAGPLADFLHVVGRLLVRERRQAHQLLGRARYFKHAAEALPQGVLAVDGEHRISWFNQGAMTLLGVKRSNRGQMLARVLRLPHVLVLLEKNTLGTIEMASPVDLSRTLELEVKPFLQGHVLLIIRDITPFKRSDAIRRDFVANASHELRTPLTVMKGYLEAMVDMTAEQLTVWQKPLVQMQNQTERMQKIVEDMLVLSALEGDDSSLSTHPVSVPLMLEQIAEEAVQLSGKRGHQVHLKIESDLGLLGHEDYLRSAFTNLVTNAVRYTPDGGSITIRWWQDEQGLYMSVCDTGIGIAPEHLDRVFERFYRVDSARSRATGGTGLGLSITRHVLERHGAVLSIESELGLGSCFCCSFALSSGVEVAH